MTEILILIVLLMNSIALWYLSVILKHKREGESHRVNILNKAAKEKLIKKLEEDLNLKIEQITKSYADALKRQAESQVIKMSDVVIKESKNLQAFIADQQKALISETQYLVANDFATVKTELEEYKKKKIAEVGEKINSIILQTAKEALGKSIDMTTHQDQVLAALERAKLDNLLK